MNEDESLANQLAKGAFMSPADMQQLIERLTKLEDQTTSLLDIVPHGDIPPNKEIAIVAIHSIKRRSKKESSGDINKWRVKASWVVGHPTLPGLIRSGFGDVNIWAGDAFEGKPTVEWFFSDLAFKLGFRDKNYHFNTAIIWRNRQYVGIDNGVITLRNATVIEHPRNTWIWPLLPIGLSLIGVAIVALFIDVFSSMKLLSWFPYWALSMVGNVALVAHFLIMYRRGRKQ